MAEISPKCTGTRICYFCQNGVVLYARMGAAILYGHVMTIEPAKTEPQHVKTDRTWSVYGGRSNPIFSGRRTCSSSTQKEFTNPGISLVDRFCKQKLMARPMKSVAVSKWALHQRDDASLWKESQSRNVLCTRKCFLTILNLENRKKTHIYM